MHDRDKMGCFASDHAALIVSLMSTNHLNKICATKTLNIAKEMTLMKVLCLLSDPVSRDILYISICMFFLE